MVDNMGNWTAEKDYTNYPKEKMCDMDHVAEAVIDFINKNNYKIKTDIENVCYILLMMITDEDGNYDISKDSITYEIESHGGVSDFDYYS